MYNVSWNEFEKISVDLSQKIKNSNKKYDFIIAVNRGGLLLGRLLSDVLDLPLGVISAKTFNKEYFVDSKISSQYPVKGNVLLVDDIFEDTALEIVKVIKQNKNVQDVDLACIFYRSFTNFKPKYFINTIKKSKHALWIYFPYQSKSLKIHADL